MKEEESSESCSHIIVLLCCDDPDRSFSRRKRRLNKMETIVPNLTIGKRRSSKLMGNVTEIVRNDKKDSSIFMCKKSFYDYLNCIP